MNPHIDRLLFSNPVVDYHVSKDTFSCGPLNLHSYCMKNSIKESRKVKEYYCESQKNPSIGQ